MVLLLIYFKGLHERISVYPYQDISGQTLRENNKTTILGACPCTGITGTKFCPAQTSKLSLMVWHFTILVSHKSNSKAVEALGLTNEHLLATRHSK